jgi:hypothetical protein
VNAPRCRRLTLKPPHPDTERVGDDSGGRGSFLAALRWRLGWLAALGLLVSWLI